MASHKVVALMWMNHKASKGTKMYSDGKTAFSYGAHFPIATWIDNNRILFNTDSYSRSTAKHCRFINNAITSKLILQEKGFNPNIEIITCTTKDIQKYLDYPKEPIVIIREVKHKELLNALDNLYEILSLKGVKRVPKKKIESYFYDMILVDKL